MLGNGDLDIVITRDSRWYKAQGRERCLMGNSLC
jgi:hypothetical protein